MTPTVIEMTDLLLAVKQATVIQLNTLYTTQTTTPLVGWLDPVPRTEQPLLHLRCMNRHMLHTPPHPDLRENPCSTQTSSMAV